LQLQQADARREAAEEYALELESREAKLKEVFDQLKQDPRYVCLSSSTRPTSTTHN
jgi:ADP-ribose pyrophosphatase YjhB (NUDIX family)